MNGRPPSSVTAAVLMAAGVFTLLAYVVARAADLSFTVDESYTYTRYVHESVWDIVRYAHPSANNHLLNTLLMKELDELGASELTLREPNVIAFVIYVAGLLVALGELRSWAARFLGLAVALLNPYLLDFFSLARGYGLELAFTAGAVAAVLAYARAPSAGRALAALSLAAVASLAHLAALTLLAAMLVIVVAIMLPRWTPPERVLNRRRVAFVCAAVTLVLVPIVAQPISRINSVGQLRFGGDHGFWRDTVHTLVWSALYRRGREGTAVVIDVIVAAVVLAGAIATARALAQRGPPTPHTVSFSLLAVAGLTTLAQHYALGTPFLVYRTALFFVPLFALWVAFAADAVAVVPRLRPYISVSAVLVVGAAALNLVSTANRSYALDWREDASTKRMLTDLDKLRPTGRTVRLGSSWVFEPTINFYRETMGLRWLSEIRRDCRVRCLEGSFDYYYVLGPDITTIRTFDARPIIRYPLSGSLLARAAVPRQPRPPKKPPDR
jgi:hypothetical protein